MAIANVIGIAQINIITISSGIKAFPKKRIGKTQRITKLNGPIINPKSSHLSCCFSAFPFSLINAKMKNDIEIITQIIR
jgi:hypothetical protein